MHVVAKEPQPAGVSDDKEDGKKRRNQRQDELEYANFGNRSDDKNHDANQPEDDDFGDVADVFTPDIDPVHILEKGSGFLHVILNMTFEMAQDKLVTDHPGGNGGKTYGQHH